VPVEEATQVLKLRPVPGNLTRSTTLQVIWDVGSSDSCRSSARCSRKWSRTLQEGGTKERIRQEKLCFRRAPDRSLIMIWCGSGSSRKSRVNAIQPGSAFASSLNLSDIESRAPPIAPSPQNLSRGPSSNPNPSLRSPQPGRTVHWLLQNILKGAHNLTKWEVKVLTLERDRNHVASIRRTIAKDKPE
jgi:hypothetical protein